MGAVCAAEERRRKRVIYTVINKEVWHKPPLVLAESLAVLSKSKINRCTYYAVRIDVD